MSRNPEVPSSGSAQGNGWMDVSPDDFAPRCIPLDQQTRPGAGEAHLWFLDLGSLARPLRGALDGHVGADDPAPFTPGQLRFARRFYLRLLIGAYLGIPGKAVRINRSHRGKPVLDATVHQEDLHFSMARSGECLLVGLADAFHVGVDLEPLERRARKPLAVAQRYFSVAEATTLNGLPAEELDDAFLRVWACKEAVVKASGHGIANQLCRFTVETRPQRRAAVLDFEGQQAADWSLSLLSPASGYLGALAAPVPAVRIRAFRLVPSTSAG